MLAHSLITKIRLEDIINTCTNLLCNNKDVIEGIKKFEFKNLCWLFKNRFSYLAMLFINKRIMWTWDCPLDLLQKMFSSHFMKSNGLNSSQRNLNHFFTEETLMTFCSTQIG